MGLNVSHFSNLKIKDETIKIKSNIEVAKSYSWKKSAVHPSGISYPKRSPYLESKALAHFIPGKEITERSAFLEVGLQTPGTDCCLLRPGWIHLEEEGLTDLLGEKLEL